MFIKMLCTIKSLYIGEMLTKGKKDKKKFCMWPRKKVA